MFVFLNKQPLSLSNVTGKSRCCCETNMRLEQVQKNRLAHICCLLPVPVSMMVDQGILMMSIIHLMCLGTKLIQFSPVVLSRLPVEMACV